MKKILLSLFILFIFFIAPAQLVGKVASIADGDTFTMIIQSKKIKVRLYGIDCPEKGQEFYSTAKQFLSGKVLNKTVSVKKLNTDPYGRTVGIARVDGVNVNEKLLEAGLAWHYNNYDKSLAWTNLEKKLSKTKKGYGFNTTRKRLGHIGKKRGRNSFHSGTNLL